MSKSDIPFGFGNCVKRFNYLGIHPELITYNTKNSLGPGQYNPRSPRCNCKIKDPSWNVKLESEEFSKYLGYHNPQLLCERNFFKSLGGPGSYDLIDYKPTQSASVFQNVGFGSGERFYNPIKDETLPPGSHNIKKIITKFSDYPTFEFDGKQTRFKNKEPKYKLPPNRYNLPNPCISDKIISLRGPYDTFTGPRDNSTIKNHFAPPLFKSPDIIYELPSALDHLLHHKSKKRCGRFLKSDRFPEGLSFITSKKGFTIVQRDEEDFPGPATYKTSPGIIEAKPNLHGFNSSNIHARPPPNWKIHPGPDRYKVKYPTCQKKKTKGSWMFMSKAPRDFVKVESYCNFIY